MKLFVVTSFLMSFNTVMVFSQVDPVDKDGIAIGGYDVVSYFHLSRPVKGESRFKSRFDNTTYYFSTEENQALFEQKPEMYVPQYDGFCALAVSYGKKISIDPETYKVTNNKLYLFFNGKTSRGQVNSLAIWNKNEARLLNKAESLWPDVKKKKYKATDTL